MCSLSILSSTPLFSTTKRAAGPRLHALPQSLGFFRRQSVLSSLPFRVSFKPPRSPLPAESQLSDVDDEEEDDDDDYEVADEYEYVSDEELDDVLQILRSDDEDETGVSVDSADRHKESTWQRVEKLCNLVKEFGKEMIDVDSLSAIYNFRIDKFQV